MWARVMPTMSSLPSAMAWRAVATSLMRAAWNTGNFVQCTDFAGEIEMRRGLHAGDRDDLGQRRVVVDVALDDVEEVDQPGIA